MEHLWIDGWCKYCGASEGGYHQTIVQGGVSSCLESTERSLLAPEPARRQFAVEDFDVIRARMEEIKR